MTIKKRVRELAIMLIFPAIAFTITVIDKPNLVTSTLLFFGLPSFYVCLRNKALVLKSGLFSLLVSFPLSWFFDVFAAKDGSWIVPRSIFPFKFFGVATGEVYIFGLLWTFFAILFHRYFFTDGGKSEGFPRKMKFFLLICGLLVAITVSVYIFIPELVTVPYFFLIAGTLFVMLPLFLFLCYHPQSAIPLSFSGLYFFVVMILFELAALYTGQWIYPGHHFIGWVQPFGLRFPLEEFFFWMILASPAMIAYYEFFADSIDEKSNRML